jgi:hypothetical protein
MARLFLAAFGALLWAGAAWAGQAGQASLQWSELGPRIVGKKVELVLPDGTSVRGKVRAIDPAGLRLDISKTSDKRVQPKGSHTIPRQAVSVLRVTGYRKIGRLLCTVGVLAAAGALVAHGGRDPSLTEGPLVVIVPAVGAAGAAGLGVGAYYIGKAADKRVTDIRIVPGD